jgi:dimethylhistidine N-methyltransferase
MDKAKNEFLNDVIEGFSAQQKWISPKYFYDAVGVDIYEEIKEVPEYYLPNHERALVAEIAEELGTRLSDVRQVVEYGGGSDVRTEAVVRALPQLVQYLPLDVAIEQLEATAETVSAIRPELTITPLLGDFASLPDLESGESESRLGFLPGSTIGNFASGGAQDFLARIRRHLGDGSHLLLGYDLVKDQEVLLAAYDDAAGVTRRFNLNLLDRINRELDGDINRLTFWHMVEYNEAFDRIETYLESTIDQIVTIAGHKFQFKAGERIHTENSHKYTEQRFAAAIEDTGWTHLKTWTSENDYYALTLLG